MVKNSNSSTPTVQNQSEKLSHFDFFNKFKHLNPLEASLGILGFCLVLLLFVGCFFNSDFNGGIRYQEISLVELASPSLTSSSLEESSGGNQRPGFLDFGDKCNIFEGNWIWDDSYPLYNGKDCAFIDGGFRCSENGRPDKFYTKWRWQPNDCDLPRFNPKLMLERLRNRRLVFVGDSVGRNQWESLLCLLSSAVFNKSSIYEKNGSPITKHNGYLAFIFKDYNCSVEYYRAPFLVHQGRAPAKAPAKVKMTLRVDTMDWSSRHWRHADVLVFNSGHWWNFEKTIRVGCYFQEGEVVKMDMSVETAYRRSLEALTGWMRTNVDPNKTQVFFRTYAPVHFRGGDWKTGGSCHLEQLPDLVAPHSPLGYQSKVLFDVLSKQSSVEKLDLLNVTSMTAQRKDGHASIYYLDPGIGPAALHRQDCSHWCLPGVPDTWNELLYAVFLKRELENSTRFPQAPA